MRVVIIPKRTFAIFAVAIACDSRGVRLDANRPNERDEPAARSAARARPAPQAAGTSSVAEPPPPDDDDGDDGDGGASGGEAGAPFSGGAPGAGSGGEAGTAGASATPIACRTPGAEAGAITRFAVIGDYGDSGPGEARVAALVATLAPDFVLTTGDNNYPSGAAETIDVNVGQYFGGFICPYRGAFGPGADQNRFFPALGNHDWNTPGAEPYLDYFTLPGNERYYDFVWGDVHVFVVDSDAREPDGVTADSAQAAWLEAGLSRSTARWQVVTLHHPPYSSSSRHGSSTALRWPFAAWGADVVFAGHDHTYERLEVDGIPYIVCGLGGRSTYPFGDALPESRARFNSGFGAELVELGAGHLVARFFGDDGALLDEVALGEQ